MIRRIAFILTIALVAACGFAQSTQQSSPFKSIQDFGVLPTNDAATNKTNLQNAINWASERGAALYVEPSADPYPIDGGIVLKMNASLIGAQGPVGRGTKHLTKPQPVGSVFAITDEKEPFITTEGATQLKGIQFWYPKQTLSDPKKIIEYPPTIQASKTHSAQGVTLTDLTFYGEFIAMDFNCPPGQICEQILIENCYGYPLSGQFVRIDYCYDVPRILHCHINPANQRFFAGGFSKAVIDSVIARKTFAYAIDHTDNAQVMDIFTFGTFGGIHLGSETYGQLTNFNFDCVTIGIHKLGGSNVNRNWQIAQGSIIANTSPDQKQEDIHPILIEGQGHTAITNVEAFSGNNPALTNLAHSQDFLAIHGDKKLTISLFGCRMRNYTADSPLSVDNPAAVIQAIGCIDKHEDPFNLIVDPKK